MARLNIFQRLTRQWDRLHPYNATQAMQLVGPADLQKIESDAFRRRVERQG
jgi:hypothetical protein